MRLGARGLNIFLVGDPASEQWLSAALAANDFTVVTYHAIWHENGSTTEESRKAVVEAVKAADAVVLDLSVEASQPPAALALGIAVTLSKNVVMVADSDAELSTAQHVLRYARSDREPDAHFVSRLTDAVENPMAEEELESREPQVFISYSHADDEYLGRLKVHLRPLQRSSNVRIWSDADILPGMLWRDEIRDAVERADIAILLVSADFLASEFIITNELPTLLKSARTRGATILPLVLTRCRFTRDPDLNIFQAVNDPDRPLAVLSMGEREEHYDKVASEVERVIKARVGAV
ncbi:putative toll/interleukin-1 receptor-like protein [metagenome]|uniref:Putative toll/interleukin-1 receptor-like protein n=1 Tax=metagenome TaxID=256318 RepID=A0A2P2C7H0_9ZZZZ